MRIRTIAVLASWMLIVGGAVAADDAARSEAHQAYAAQLWEFLHRPGNRFDSWGQWAIPLSLPVGPAVDEDDTVYANSVAASRKTLESPFDVGSVLVCQHKQDGQEVGVTVWFRPSEDYAESGWYFAHFAPDGTVVKTSVDKGEFNKKGFVTALENGRLWVFRLGTSQIAEWASKGAPEKSVTMPGAGPQGMTMKAFDKETIVAYNSAADGFVTFEEDGRLWFFAEGSDDLADYLAQGEPAKSVTRPGAGPSGMTVKSTEADTLDKYLEAIQE
ncbi:MAG: hypothetical protein R3C28_29475 [Pirellulaceae bacterium]